MRQRQSLAGHLLLAWLLTLLPMAPLLQFGGMTGLSSILSLCLAHRGLRSMESMAAATAGSLIGGLLLAPLAWMAQGTAIPLDGMTAMAVVMGAMCGAMLPWGLGLIP
jgi:hypothetical protein